MIAFIGSIIKYSIISVAILISSHIIQIGGVTISDHVKHTLQWVSVYTPSMPTTKGFTETISRSMSGRYKEIDKIDSEVSPEDQRELDQVIENSQGRRVHQPGRVDQAQGRR